MDDYENWSATKKVKYRLLHRAFAENRGPKVILAIQWRTAAARHAAEPDRAALEIFASQNEGEPQAIRALNLLEQKLGSNTRFRDMVPEWKRMLEEAPVPSMAN